MWKRSRILSTGTETGMEWKWPEGNQGLRMDPSVMCPRMALGIGDFAGPFIIYFSIPEIAHTMT